MVQGMANGGTWQLQQAESLALGAVEKLNKLYDGNVFVPNKEQMVFLRSIFHPTSGNCVDDWLDHAKSKDQNVTREKFDIWCKQIGFQEWILNEAERRFSFYKLEWLKIGVTKMQANIRTWTEMGRIFFKDGIEHEPAVAGSRRQKLEQEMKRILKVKNEKEKT